MAQPFPFAAIVAQEDMKKALLMAAVEPLLGGVLIFGDRGTGKSTAVRALAELLPRIETRTGCRYNCLPAEPQAACPICSPDGDGKRPPITKRRAPMIDLPLGATEDRICGALDIEKALVAGEKHFEPGLLAAANRGFLYIDEVNLLEDHLVDLLLDAAASGVNVVEREGLSIRHAARFVLVGSGNPEEGDLRPQLLDRFGLSVEVRTIEDLPQRIDVIRRRDAYETDPEAFCKSWAKRDAAIGNRVVAARKILRDVEIPDNVVMRMSQLCLRLGIDGMRGELTLMRACRAAAALSGTPTVTWNDVAEIAPMVLCHRLRRDPLDDAGSTPRIERALATVDAGYGHG
ncbi:magnesium chelatase ATPase subunit I [Rhizobium sp. Root274]|uniref:magnesium chelatase ATPase subunit I n=1 Tax=unclassified Rhizobium TaxID=2613769 RepID=UPI0007149F40|nr:MULTISPECIES: magnesium chelatase ATPase subunit I [unclassified Rhizobium]KQW29609.1 magnesium chelatase ATPase subunit I [Rhizobium sp. Root1240]KRD29801.1 magnesium chelatase ATPase subunit I [Rhizobium sp. Root274]